MDGENQSGPVTVKLREPIVWGEKTIAEITIRRPRAGDFRGLKYTDETIGTDFALKLAEKLSGQISNVIDKLSNDDWMEIRAVVLGFLSPSDRTGASA